MTNAAEAERRIREYQAVTIMGGPSTHDLIRELLAYCAGTPVPFGALYGAVNAKQPQERAAVQTVLEAFPYFVPAEGDCWTFAPDVHRKLLTALATGGFTLPQGPPTAPAPPPVAPAPMTQPAPPPRNQPTPSPVTFPPHADVITREQVKRLLSLRPERVSKLLDDILADFWPVASMKEELDIAHVMGWFSGNGSSRRPFMLTRAGRTLAALRPSGRADALRDQLARLPAYAMVDEALGRETQLTFSRVSDLIVALPTDYRLHPQQVFLWLGWSIQVRNLGTATESLIVLHHAGTQPAVETSLPGRPEEQATPRKAAHPPKAPRLDHKALAAERLVTDMKIASRLAAQPALNPSADGLVQLTDIEPQRLMSLLDRLREGWPVDGSLLAAGRTVADLKWCVSSRKGQFGLTVEGRDLAALGSPARAAVMRALFQRLPGYRQAEQWLKDEGILTPERVRLILQAVPPGRRAHPEALYRWVSWVIQQMELGQVSETKIVISPSARAQLK